MGVFDIIIWLIMGDIFQKMFFQVLYRNLTEQPVGFRQNKPLNSELSTCVHCYCKPLGFSLKLNVIVYFASDLAVFSFERRWWYWRFNVLSWLSSSSIFSLEAMLQAPLIEERIFSRGYCSHVIPFSPSGPTYVMPFSRNATLSLAWGLECLPGSKKMF